MEKLHIYYRLSDKGENKERLPIINNKSCLENFIKHFPSSNIEIIADNVLDETYEWLTTLNFLMIHRTFLGNSGSFWYTCKLVKSLPINDYVYFVENDYIHRPDSLKILLEGLEIAEYVTLYDHLDKYINGINPKVKNGGKEAKYFSLNQHTGN